MTSLAMPTMTTVVLSLVTIDSCRRLRPVASRPALAPLMVRRLVLTLTVSS